MRALLTSRNQSIYQEFAIPNLGHIEVWPVNIMEMGDPPFLPPNLGSRHLYLHQQQQASGCTITQSVSYQFLIFHFRHFVFSLTIQLPTLFGWNSGLVIIDT